MGRPDKTTQRGVGDAAPYGENDAVGLAGAGIAPSPHPSPAATASPQGEAFVDAANRAKMS